MNNKLRVLKLIQILRKYTDMEHKLSIREIISMLEEEGISTNDRRTLYDDFKALQKAGFEVEYDNGEYYLMEAPFTLSEVKIIIDSLNSLKNLDDKFLQNLKAKLYSFLSEYETELLDKLEYHNKHSDKKFINRLEDTLEAIKSENVLIIKRSNKTESEEIVPIFLYRNNDFYYLYYHYVSNSKIYHTRFDNITSMRMVDKKDDIIISKSKIIEVINESTNSFYSNKAENINFRIINNSEYLSSRIADDFPNAIFTASGFSIKASVNNALFAKLTSYGDDIKISDKKTADQYIKFLNKIITRNKAKD